MRFSRHAKNEMRLYGIRHGDVAAAIANPIHTRFDRSGNWRLTGWGMDRRAIIVVLTGDEPGFVIMTFRTADMRALYDSDANAISIELAQAEKADRADQVHERAVVAIGGGQPIELQLLYPDEGITEPLAAAAVHHGLDREALAAAAAAALAAPGRSVSVDVALRPAA